MTPAFHKVHLNFLNILIFKNICIYALLVFFFWVSFAGDIISTPVKGYLGDDSLRQNTSGHKDFSFSDTSVSLNATQSEIFIPEGFSPNGDGVNDYFVIKGADSYKISLKVFNRWGNKVYESGSYNNEWNGISNIGLLISSQLPGGTYYYIVNLNNGEKARVGYLTLIR